MSTAQLSVVAEPLPSVSPVVDIVVPVYNETAALEGSIQRLRQYLTTRFPLSWAITIAENGSTDDSWAIAHRLSDTLDGVDAIHLDPKGRGLALRTAWSASASPVVAYITTCRPDPFPSNFGSIVGPEPRNRTNIHPELGRTRRRAHLGVGT